MRFFETVLFLIILVVLFVLGYYLLKPIQAIGGAVGDFSDWSYELNTTGFLGWLNRVTHGIPTTQTLTPPNTGNFLPGTSGGGGGGSGGAF